jgi:3-oxoacyl-[acyl-carrier-protein] synthase II
LPQDLALDQPCKIAGMVPSAEQDADGGLDTGDRIAAKERKKMDRFIELALVAADEAMAHAAWSPTSESERSRVATIIASGVGGFPAIADAVRLAQERGIRRLSPFTVPSFLVNLAAGHVSIRHGLRGPLGAPATACAASVQAIGDAARLIRVGEADMAVCGGAEAVIDAVTLGSFAAARALSTQFNEEPHRASRPFDRARDGFVIGEGAAILVIEALEHALARGAKPLAEVVGYGSTADAFHITAGPEDGRGAREAMEVALRQACLSACDIQYLSAHATSTPVGDASELRAVKAVFGAGAKVAISSSKGATGHMLGAAGATAAVFSTLALQHQVAPMTLNLAAPDEAVDGLDLIRGAPRALPIEHAMLNGFGFGGVNASLILRRYAASEVGAGTGARL